MKKFLLFCVALLSSTLMFAVTTKNYAMTISSVEVEDVSAPKYSEYDLTIMATGIWGGTEYCYEIDATIDPDEASLVGTFTYDESSLSTNTVVMWLACATGSVSRTRYIDEGSTLTITSKGNNKYGLSGQLVCKDRSGGVVTTILNYNFDTEFEFQWPAVTEPTADRRIFAYDLRMTEVEDVCTFAFKTNIAPLEANIVLYRNGAIIDRKPVEVSEALAYSVAINKSDIAGIAGEKMAWGVEVKAGKVEEIAEIYNEGVSARQRMFLNMDLSTESPYFGRIYANNRATSSSVKGAVYGQDYSMIKADAVTLGNAARPAVDAEGTVYWSDYGDATAGIRVMNPTTFVSSQLFHGSPDGNGLYTSTDGAPMCGSTMCAEIWGTGAETQLWVQTEDGGTGLYANGAAVFQLGQPDGSILHAWDAAPTKAVNVNNGVACAFSVRKTARGLWWGCNRDQNVAPNLSLVFVTNDGVRKFDTGSSFDGITGSAGGGMNINADESKLYLVNQSGNILVYDVAWSEDTVPTLTRNSVIETAYASISSIVFDPAGNMVTAAGTYGTKMNLVVYSMPTDSNAITIPAAKSQAIKFDVAAPLADLKIYINPGHGGWNEMNDRHIPTMPFPEYDTNQHWDTLGFWESSSNLKVANDLRDWLLEAGVAPQNIKLSRETNKSGLRDVGELDWDLHRVIDTEVTAAEGDRTFAAIKAEAAEMEPDILLSIHSNAAGYIGAAANYVVAYIEGNENCANIDQAYTGDQYATSATALSYAKTLVKWQLDPLDSYHEAPNGYVWSYRDSWSMLTDAYDGQATYDPTVLVEASFHSYLPNAHRFLNRDYQKEEAYRFFMALNEIFGDGAVPATGVICGDVRSLKEKAAAGSWNPKTDACPDEPDGFGNMILGKDQYMPIDGALVELLSGDDVIQSYTTDNYHNGLYFFFNVAPGQYKVRVTKDRYLVTEQDATIGTLAADNIATINFRMPFTQEEEEEHKPKYVDGDLGLLDSVLVANELTVRRALSHGQYLFVLALKADNTPYLYRVNKRGTVVQQLSTSECTVNSGRVLGDIALSDDGVLFGCNNETYLDGSKTTIPNLIYRWEKDGSMEVFYENYYAGGGYYTTANWLIGDAGECMTFIGDSQNGKIVFASENVNPSSPTRYNIRWVMFEIQYGDVVKRNIQIPKGRSMYTTTIGAQYQLHTYKNDIVLSGSVQNHYQMTAPAGVDDAETDIVCTRTDLNGVLNFTIGKYNEKISMFVPTTAGIDIYDVDTDFLGTTKESVPFEGSYDGGFMSAGTFAGDTLWLLRNNHLQILPEMSEDPTGLIEAQRGRSNATKVMQNGVMYIFREGRKYDLQGSIVK